MNATEKREYLKNNLDQINMVLSAILGFKTELRIKEKEKRTGEIIFSLDDDRNIVDLCGVMKHAFKNVTIHSFGVWWNDNGVNLEFDFCYEHIDCGSNGAEFCRLSVKNNFVQIIK